MDSEMQKVADAHLLCGKGTSVKCLACLRVDAFMTVGSDKWKGQTLPGAGDSACCREQQNGLRFIQGFN